MNSVFPNNFFLSPALVKWHLEAIKEGFNPDSSILLINSFKFISFLPSQDRFIITVGLT
nr:MAG TPA: hypothetical protein [Caudoviricetes sp.]